jgi:hypothetical protein
MFKDEWTVTPWTSDEMITMGIYLIHFISSNQIPWE